MDGTAGNISIGLTSNVQHFVKGMGNAADVIKDFETRAKLAKYEVEQLGIASIKSISKINDATGRSAKRVLEVIEPTAKYLAANNEALRDNQEQVQQVAKDTIMAVDAEKQLTNSLKSTSNALWLMSTGLQQFGRSLTMSFTVPIMAVAGLAVKTFTEWEKGTLAIQRAAEITRESANKITDSFVDISLQVPITVEELQKAGYAAAQAGATGEKAVTNFATAAVKLSKVGGDALKDLPIEKLANDLAKLAIGFGEAGESMEEVNNIASMLLSVAKAVPGGLAEVVEGLRRVQGPAATLNVSLADTTALIGALIASGVPAARAGTELGRVFLDMVKNIDKVGESLGYTTENFGEFKERMETDVMGVLTELLERYNQVESGIDRAAHLQEIFGTTSLRALLPLIENIDMVRDLQARANHEIESGALLAAEFAIQANSLSGTMTVFGNSLKALSGVIGDDLAPYINYFLKTITEGLRKLVETWQNLNPHVKAAVFIFGGLLAIIGPLALLLNTVFLQPISGINTFLTFLRKLNTSLGLTAFLTKIGSAGMFSFGGAVTGAIPAVIGLTKALGVMLLGLGKILIVVALVAGAIYGIGKLLGIGFKMPSMPEIKLPKYPKLKPTEHVPGESPEELAEADAKAAKKKEKALSKELRDKKKARKKELRTIEDGIDAYEKVRDAEIKGRQKLVDEQRDALDQRRELWEDERRIEEEKIRGQEETLEVVKKTLKAAQKSLKGLKDTRDDELDAAENWVDYAEMNLDALQEQLKREKILGKDEFDIRAEGEDNLITRIKDAEKSLKDARSNELKVKKVWQAKINIAEKEVDDVQNNVDIQADALDELKDALAERKAIVDKEVDILQDELKIRQDALADTREATQEKLDLMQEEKDVRQRAWDDEVEILQDRLDDARDQAADIADMPQPELPDVPGSWQAINDELEKQFEELQGTIGASLEMGPYIKEEGRLGKLERDFKKAWEGAKELSETEGRSAGIIYVEAMYNSYAEKIRKLFEPIKKLSFDALVGEGAWEDTKIKAKEQGKSTSEYLWDGIIKEIKEFPQKIKKAILDFLFGRDVWEALNIKAKEEGKSVSQYLWDGLSGELKKTPEKIKASIKENIIDPIGGLLYQMRIKGKEIIGNIAQGIWDGLIWVKDAVKSVISWSLSGIGNLLGDANQWGRDMIGKFAQGIWDGMDWVKDAIRNMTDWIKGILHFSEPDFGPLKEVKDWGKDMMKSYIGGIRGEIPNLENILSEINVNKDIANGGNNLATTRPAETASTVAGTTINKNYYIQPGQMIASRGEVRSFVRMIREYDQFEEKR